MTTDRIRTEIWEVTTDQSRQAEARFCDTSSLHNDAKPNENETSRAKKLA